MGKKSSSIKITSPEKTAKINTNNMLLKEDFLAYLKSLKRSEGTITGYDSDLTIVFTYILDNLNNKDFKDLTKRDIIRIQNWLVDSNCSSARIRRVKAAMSSLSNYCENILSDEEEEYANFRSVIRKIESPALQPVKEKTIWSEAELNSLLEKVIEIGRFDLACYLALGMFSGRRKAELARFKVSDFDSDKLVCGGALYKSSPIKTKGRSGGKIIPCYTLAKKFKPYFDLYMDYRKKHGIESVWLFPNMENTNEHVKITTLNSWANTFSRLSGRNFYAHSLRHYFTTCLARAGIPDGVIQSIVNWESSDMVRLYDDTDADEQIAMYFKDGEIIIPEKKNLSDL